MDFKYSTVAISFWIFLNFLRGALCQYPVQENSNVSLPWFNVRRPTISTSVTTTIPTETTPETTVIPEIKILANDNENEIQTTPAVASSTAKSTMTTTTTAMPATTTLATTIPVTSTMTTMPATTVRLVPKKHIFFPPLRSSFRYIVFCPNERKYAVRCKTAEELKKMPKTGTIWGSGAALLNRQRNAQRLRG